MCKVSVIVPVYNAEKKLDKCVKSILAQTHQDIEVILVNDGSTDGSLTICNKYAIMDPRVIVYTGPNRGCIQARRTGINISMSPYSVFVDADDWIHKDMISVLCTQARATGADITVCNQYKVLSDRAFIRKTNKTEYMREHLYEGEELKKLTSCYLYGHPFPASLFGKLYKTELLRNSGKYLHRIQFLGEDLYFNLEMFLKAKKIKVIPTPYYYYRTGGTTSKYMSYLFNDMIAGYSIQKEVIFEHYQDTREEQLTGISIMLMNTLRTCLKNLISSQLDNVLIHALISEYVNHPSVVDSVNNIGAIEWMDNDYMDAVRKKDTLYLHDIGLKLSHQNKIKQFVIGTIAKAL